MKCTDCSTTVRPIVAVDIDGTISEYHKALADFVWRYYHREPAAEPWNGVGDYEDYLGISRYDYGQAKLAFRQSGLKRSATPYPDALDFMGWITRLGVELWICTARPWSRLDNVDPDTREWLRRNHVVYDHLLLDEDKYHKLADLVDPERVIAVVDDLPEMLESARLNLPDAKLIMMCRDHNALDWNPLWEHCSTFLEAANLINIAKVVWDESRN